MSLAASRVPARTGLSDTDIETERVRAEGFRRMSAAKKFSLVDSLTTSLRRNAMQALRDTYPMLSAAELRRKFVELHYGNDLATRVADYLRQRDVRR